MLFICEVYFYGIKLVTFVLILLSSSKASSVTHMFFLFCLIENNVCKCIYCCLNHIHIARRCLCIYINVENEMGLKVHVQRWDMQHCAEKSFQYQIIFSLIWTLYTWKIVANISLNWMTQRETFSFFFFIIFFCKTKLKQIVTHNNKKKRKRKQELRIYYT